MTNRMSKAPAASAISSQLGRRLVERLKMKHLLQLQAIRKHGSLTRVAQHMATSQPAVTQTLADLETLFGAPLFTHPARGMEPTALGELVLSRTEAMLADIYHWAQDCEVVGHGRAAHLHVGVIPFLPGRMLADAISRTRPQGRSITVTLHEDTSKRRADFLRLDRPLNIALWYSLGGNDTPPSEQQRFTHTR